MKTMTTALPVLVLLGLFNTRADAADHESAYRSTGSLPVPLLAGSSGTLYPGAPGSFPPSSYSFLGATGESASSSDPATLMYGPSGTPPPFYNGYPHPSQAGYPWPPPAGHYPGNPPSAPYVVPHHPTPYPHYPMAPAGYPETHAPQHIAPLPEPTADGEASPKDSKLSPAAAQALTAYLASTAIPLEGSPDELSQAIRMFNMQRSKTFEALLYFDENITGMVNKKRQSYTSASFGDEDSRSVRKRSISIPGFTSKTQRAQQALQDRLKAADDNKAPFVALTTAAGARYSRVKEVAQSGLTSLADAEKASS